MALALRWSTLVFLAALACGCSTQTIAVKVLRPAAVDLARFKNIAVDDFQGPQGLQLAEEISVGLNNSVDRRTGERHFTIVDRRHLDQVLRELERQRGDLWDPNSARGLGKLIGAAVLVHGRIEAPPVQEEMAQGLLFQDPQTGQQYIMYTRTATARLAAYLKATDTETGRVVDEIKYSEESTEQTTATNAEPPYIDHDALISAVRRAVVEKYLQRVVPYEVTVNVQVYIDGDFPQLATGNGYAQVGDWDRALENYQVALSLMTGEFAERDYKALHNIGIAHLYSHRFEEARQALSDAFARGHDPVSLHALQQIDGRRLEVQQLRSQGMFDDATPGGFGVPGGTATPLDRANPLGNPPPTNPLLR